VLRSLFEPDSHDRYLINMILSFYIDEADMEPFAPHYEPLSSTFEG